MTPALGLCGPQLGHRGRRAVEFAGEQAHHHRIDQGPGDGRLGLGIGQHELGILEFDQGFAEDLAAADVVDGQLDGALHVHGGVEGDDHSLPGQLVHQVGEARPRRLTDQIGRRHEHVIEEELGGILGVHPELLEIAPTPEAVGVVRLHDDQGEAPSRPGSAPVRATTTIRSAVTIHC